MKIYGVVNSQTNEFIDVSKTERGAKQIATRGGYTMVGYRLCSDYFPRLTHVKKSGKWVAVMPEWITK